MSNDEPNVERIVRILESQGILLEPERAATLAAAHRAHTRDAEVMRNAVDALEEPAGVFVPIKRREASGGMV